MINLNELARGGTLCTTTAGLKIGDGAKTGVAIGTTFGFALKGQLYSKAAADTNIPLTAADAQGLLSTCLYLLCINAAGTVTSVKGKSVKTADLTAKTEVLHWPEPTANTTPFGAVKMVTASTANFTAGTTALDATNCTASYINLLAVPEAPLTS